MKFIIKYLFYPWWVWWSNIYWKYKKVNTTYPTLKEEFIPIDAYLFSTAEKLKKVFTYTKDGPEQLFDTVAPPAYIAKQYYENDIKDDCDGFHAGLLWFAHTKNIECYLIKVTSTKNKYGHTMLLYNNGEKYRICDYTRFYTIDKAKEMFLEKTGGEYAYCIVEYNFDSCKYELTDISI